MKSNALSTLVGSRIGRVREEHHETQEQLGKAIGVKRENVTFWENGSRGISIKHLKSIAEHYDVSTDFLLGILPEGITDIQGDRRVTQRYTGLSNSALKNVKNIKDNYNPEVMGTLNAILSNPNFIDVLNDIFKAALILGIPNQPNMRKWKPFMESNPQYKEVQEDKDGNHYLLLMVDYREASRYAKQNALESFGKVIDEVIGEDGK